MPFVDKTAAALFQLHRSGFLKDADFREPVIRFIRNSTETNYWHLTCHYRSRKAAALIRERAPRSIAQYHSFCHRNLSHEHMVPDIFVYRTICAEPNVTLEYLQETLRTFGLRATITKDENREHFGCDPFRWGMPPEFSMPDHALCGDPLARYIVSGLFQHLEPRVGDTWWGPNGAL